MIQCLLSGFNGITVYCQFNRICQNRRRADQYKKSVDLSAQITIFKKWLKMGKNRTLKNGDRPTFFKKTLQKWWVWEIMAITNGVNAVVVPFLWGIETFLLQTRLPTVLLVVPFLWGIETKILTELLEPFFSKEGCTFPMRDWNSQNWATKLLTQVKIVVPMRD